MGFSHKSLWGLVGLVLIVLCVADIPNCAAKERLIRVLVLDSVKARVRADGKKNLFVKGISLGNKKISAISLSANPLAHSEGL